MNILHITTFLQGGAGRMIFNIAAEQKKQGHHVVVLTSKTGEPGYGNYDEYILGLRDKQVFLHEADSTFKRDLYLNLKVVDEARKIITRNDIDIIHAHAAVPALVGIIARQVKPKYIPVVQTMHGYGMNKNLQQQETDTIIMSCLDRVIAVSQDSKKLLMEKAVNEQIIQVIYNGIMDNYEDTDVNDRDMKEVDSWKDQGFKIIGCIGTVCERKNQALLVEAFKGISKKINARCVLIGEGDMIPALKQEASHHGLGDKVKFYGYKANAIQYLKRFDCFVLPSLSEGFGIAIIEAFREKIPVVASNIDVFKEIIDDGKTGFLFGNNECRALEECICKCLSLNDGERQELVSSAYRKYMKEFTFENMFRSYMRLYQELIDRKNSFGG